MTLAYGSVSPGAAGRSVMPAGCEVPRSRPSAATPVTTRWSDVVTQPDASLVDWVTAVALELAFSSADDASGVARLRDVGRDDPDVLERARSQLHAVTVGDAATRSRAMALLDDALAQLRRSR